MYSCIVLRKYAEFILNTAMAISLPGNVKILCTFTVGFFLLLSYCKYGLRIMSWLHRQKQKIRKNITYMLCDSMHLID